jgi:hypothetical protein
VNGEPSSRTSLSAAGWGACSPTPALADVPANARPLTWLSPGTLLQSRNDILAKRLRDPTPVARRAWVARMRAAGADPAARLAAPAGATGDTWSFLVLGDPGEGDASQYAVVPSLAARGGDAAFMVICSDVIYPAGDVADYAEKFLRPYRRFGGPIYAVPGNHDWYDGLQGFMFHFCDADPARAPAGEDGLRGLLARTLWRRPDAATAAAREARDRWRQGAGRGATQPGPYWAMDAGPVRLVGIDTGITGGLDREQGDWLRRVSTEDPRPKVLLTGKPLIVDGAVKPGPIEGGGTVDAIVRDPAANYVAALGGDIHNYQRYPVRLPDGRLLQYVVTGAGGAYTSATHRIPRVALPGCDEADFRCYPRRGDSLAFYSRLYDRRLAHGAGRLAIDPDQAAAIMAERLGIAPTRPTGMRITTRSRRAAARVFPLPGHLRGPLHLFFSEFFDWNEPPLFKSFVRVDVTPGALRLRCFAATGCARNDAEPPLEDDVEIAL